MKRIIYVLGLISFLMYGTQTQAQTVHALYVSPGANFYTNGSDTLSIWGNLIDSGIVASNNNSYMVFMGDSMVIGKSASFNQPDSSATLLFKGNRPSPYAKNTLQYLLFKGNTIAKVYNIQFNSPAGVWANVRQLNTKHIGFFSGPLIVDSLMVIDNASNAVYGYQTSYNSVTYANSGYVNGMMVRKVGASGNYDFPVGTSANYELIQMNNQSLTGTSQLAVSFTPNNIGCTLPKRDSLGSIQELLDGGHWTVIPDIQPLSGSYSVRVNERGYIAYPGSPAQMTVLKRDNCISDWKLKGINMDSTQHIAYNTATAYRSALTSFSEFGIGWGDSPLPITLQNFDGSWDNNDAALHWRTANEIDSKGFDVQRSTDGVTFTTIDFQTSKGINGNSNYVLDYNYRDNNIKNKIEGNVYYRLKHFDLNERYSYSQIVILNNHATDIYKLVIYPSPSKGSNVNAQILSPTKQSVELHIINMQGQVIYNEIKELQEGINIIPLNLVDLPSGFYNIQMINKSTIISSPIIIAR